jgi:RimJ/RimL family protein N-acetyltransferase
MTARARGVEARQSVLQRTATLRHLKDVSEVRAHLQRARALAAYALAYLDPRFFPLADFHEIVAGDSSAIAMHASGGLGPSTLLIGDPSLIARLLELHPGPRQAFLTCETRHVETIRATHDLWRPQRMLRLRLDRANFVSPSRPHHVRRLTGADAAELNRLYGEEGSRHTGRQIVEGVYYGSYHRSRLVAAAGTHIYSRREGVGVIGNVYTRPDFRGRGLGTQVTGAVAAHLLHDCELIVLNVDPANHAARHVYKQLGFHEAGSLIEAMSTRRAAYSPLPLLRRAVARQRADRPETEVIQI